MSSTFDTSPSAEDWNAYRKLVVETLRRLDERTLELHEAQGDIKKDIFVLQQKDPEKTINELRKLVTDSDAELRKQVTDAVNNFEAFKKIIDDERTSSKSRNKIFMTMGNAVWGVVVAIGSACLGVIVPLLIHHK